MVRTNPKLGLLVAILVCAAATATAGTDDLDRIGPILLGRSMLDLSGNTVSLEDYRGEVLVVNFWASWCAPCRRELPVLDEWNTDWRSQGARVVAISIDSRAGNARTFVKDAELGLTAWIDGTDGLAAELDLPAVPTSFVIDRDGEVVLRIVGSSAADLDKMHSKVQELLASKPKGPKA